LKRASKHCFFEKKQQKTFGSLGAGALNQHTLKGQKFFWFFFFKKRTALF
jgi:hypothetical protein